MNDILALASEAESALRALVDAHGQTSLGTALEHVRRYRVRIETRLAVESAVSAKPESESELPFTVFMHHGKACRVVRRYTQEMPIETLVGGFSFAGVRPTEVADIVYLSDWNTATVCAEFLREVV